MNKKLPSFRDVFVEVGQDTLDKQRDERQFVVSVTPLVTGLMVLGAAGYFLTPYLTIVLLVLALIALWGRWVLLRQVTGDIRDMKMAQAAFEQGKQPEECLEFIRLRSSQMLQDNKMLSTYGKEQVLVLQQWAMDRSE
ncbi:MAG: hypothetical protein Q3976_02055 [Corynebacterium sp.]|nr:hypothetical protein [Corynebacterium sp.]